MKPIISVVAGLIAVSLPVAASAQVYQWKDSSGRTIISDSPPPSSAKGSRSIGTNPPPSTVPGTSENASGPKTAAEKDLDFKKRQQEAKDKAAKDAKEQAAAAERKDNCERARRQLAMLESGTRIATQDANGERRLIEDAERQQEIERTRKIVADSCK